MVVGFVVIYLCVVHFLVLSCTLSKCKVNSLSGKDWIPKWEAKVVMATVTKAQTLGASKALILCIAGGNHCDAEMARQPTLVRAIKAEMEDPAFRVRVECANGKGKGKEKSTVGKNSAAQNAAGKPGKAFCAGILQKRSGTETAARNPHADVKAKQSTHKMPCRECGKTFKDWHDVRSKHWLCKGREPLCICAQCDKAFEDDVSCAQHQSSTGHKGMARVNYGEDPTWECGQCNKTFATPEGCQQHQTTTGHGDTPCCSTCMKTFQDERSLLQHQKSTKHAGILWLMGDSESGSSSGSYAESGGEDLVSADGWVCAGVGTGGCGRVFSSECAVSQHQDATGHLGISYCFRACPV
ncbi:unnamed protein product [Polarella glacialis]|uniref:C2H2-type domain-containing protein n=1 Tax=Polarella glacialis TaxID=89957 RepID=A0A813HDX3_POLGL|nr:unnamed protein product [Polarella glacialis]